eukprot:TRINITY_DN9368_c0_g1_i1.p1 TRINITY_DN9368_c0_g1~~TRINITY_DN9368_c0_g1_i1.p1  ORF type:complete len:185 (-),score=32.72 TRINITY_DN9368_c0_g1_i1:82-636(-)
MPPKHAYTVEVAVVGLEGSGKTSLVQQLRQHSQGNYIAGGCIDATPTAGQEIDTWVCEGTRVRVKEVGGTFVASWDKHVKDHDVLLFLIDMSNHGQLGSACVELHTLLLNPAIAAKPVLVVLAKLDMPAVFEKEAFATMSQWTALVAGHPELQLHLAETSAFTGERIPAVWDFIMERRVPVSKN